MGKINTAQIRSMLNSPWPSDEVGFEMEANKVAEILTDCVEEIDRLRGDNGRPYFTLYQCPECGEVATAKLWNYTARIAYGSDIVVIEREEPRPSVHQNIEGRS